MRALVMASMAASLLFTGATPSLAAGTKLKAFMEALVDMQNTEEDKVKTAQPKGPKQPSKPKPQ